MEDYMDYYGVVEKARKTGKVDKGTNEVTKAIERGVAKVVFYAADVEPKEIVAHLSIISNEKGIPCYEVDSKQKLGIAVGIPVSTSAVAVLELGEADKELKMLEKRATDEIKKDSVEKVEETKEEN
jgi:large subunit ribosomal protein L7Ae